MKYYVSKSVARELEKLGMHEDEHFILTRPIPDTAEEALEGFPWEYKGAGYWRLKGVPKGETAAIRHADQILKELVQYLKDVGIIDED